MTVATLTFYDIPGWDGEPWEAEVEIHKRPDDNLYRAYVPCTKTHLMPYYTLLDALTAARRYLEGVPPPAA